MFLLAKYQDMLIDHLELSCFEHFQGLHEKRKIEFVISQWSKPICAVQLKTCF